MIRKKMEEQEQQRIIIVKINFKLSFEEFELIPQIIKIKQSKKRKIIMPIIKESSKIEVDFDSF